MDAYAGLVSSGFLVSDVNRAEPDFREAYEWLSAEMARRLDSAESSIIWAWARIRYRDLLDIVRTARGDVLLSLEVAAERVLLSGFDDWHAALNKSLLVPPLHGESQDEWSARAEPLIEDFERRLRDANCACEATAEWPRELRKEMETSWSSMFEPSTWSERGPVQATLSHLTIEDVRSAAIIR